MAENDQVLEEARNRLKQLAAQILTEVVNSLIFVIGGSDDLSIACIDALNTCS